MTKFELFTSNATMEFYFVSKGKDVRVESIERISKKRAFYVTWNGKSRFIKLKEVDFILKCITYWLGYNNTSYMMWAMARAQMIYLLKNQ